MHSPIAMISRMFIDVWYVIPASRYACMHLFWGGSRESSTFVIQYIASSFFATGGEPPRKTRTGPASFTSPIFIMCFSYFFPNNMRRYFPEVFWHDLKNPENIMQGSTCQKNSKINCAHQQEQQAFLDPTASPQTKNRRRLRWLSPNDKTQSGQSKQWRRRRRRRRRRLIFPLHGGDAATDRQCVLITQGGWIKRRRKI